MRVADEDPPEVGLDGPDESEEVIRIDDTVYFSAEVNTKNVTKLVRCLHEANGAALTKAHYPSDARVYLYIHSSGGDAFAGLSAMDLIRCNRVSVVTVAHGYVASSASLMLLGADERKIMSNAKILIHQLSTAFFGKYGDLLDEVANSKELMQSFQKVYSQRTSLSAKKVESLLTKELHINATTALRMGFVDEIW